MVVMSPNLSPAARRRIYSKDQLVAYDLLDFPVWVFDIVNKAMWWANGPACYLWDAPDCESLCNRDFATGMSHSTDQSMLAWLEAFREGKTKSLTWTFHPNQGKAGPKTCELLTSGIYVSKTGKEDDGYLCMLVVIKQVIETEKNNKAEETKIRRTEMLRHFPIVARQFNFEGKLMDQNPQAHVTFGSPIDAEPSETICPTEQQQQKPRDPASKLRRMTEIVRPESLPSSRTLLKGIDNDTTTNNNNNKNDRTQQTSNRDNNNNASQSRLSKVSEQSNGGSAAHSHDTFLKNGTIKRSHASSADASNRTEPQDAVLKNGKSGVGQNTKLNGSHKGNSRKSLFQITGATNNSDDSVTANTVGPPVQRDNATTTTTTTSQDNRNVNGNKQMEENSPMATNTNHSSQIQENSTTTSSSSAAAAVNTPPPPAALQPNMTTQTNDSNEEPICDFLAQFVDLEAGRIALREVSAGRDYSTEAQQITLEGPKWFTVNVRRIQDPVTSEPVIIYSGRDITKVMESAKLEADKQNMKRNEFFAVMAHEIRTPLHQVVGFIELLASSGLNAEQTESVDMLQSSTHALMAIINDLLDFTKLEAGKMKLEIIPFEVRGVLDGSVAAVQPQVHEKGLIVKCNVDQKIPIKLLGDPNRLRQIVLNMLTNAVKFTKKGEIIVESKRIKKENGQMTVRFSVKDSGIGIPSDKCDRIFNPYQQADASVSRNYGGTGLGLAICKSLVENMGGNIGVESELGKGALFWFEIPFGIFMKGHHQEATDHNAQSTDDLTSLRVLVAEDNKVNQKVVCKMLSRLNHEAVVVQNGQEAVMAVTENTGVDYDIVLMDWQMPVMDGIDATKEIRRKGYSMSKLPIVGLTASIQGLDWYAIGMNDCLKKPIRIADLKSALAKNMQ